MNSFGREAIWLSVGSIYKFVLCSQNDGPTCSAGHQIFSVDQVPGSPSNQQVGNSFTGIFSSASAPVATTGILRLGTGDQICWRNGAGSGNVCISKDAYDVLTWPSSLKFLQIGAPSGVQPGYDYLWADSASNRWNMINNNGAQQQIVASGVDIDTSDRVIQLHFGSTALPTSPVAPSTNQYLYWDGSHISGVTFANPVTCASTSLGYAVTYFAGAWSCTEIIPPVLKHGTGSGNYSSASSTFVDVDTTNLKYSVLVPTGSNLVVTAWGTLQATAGPSTFFIAISDSGTPLNQQDQEVSSGGTPQQAPFSMSWVLAGDGFTHVISLQYKTGGGSSSNATVLNSGGTIPGMMITVQ